jgi:exopolyphosphatase / guanosine-5'-triphosphate,3'-diphosphate pyrophosphatase
MPTASRFAAVDVGSNSIKLRIAAREEAAGSWRWTVLRDEVVVTGLGRGLSARRTLDGEAAAATLAVLHAFARAVATHDCAGVAAVGTQCLREADDGAAFAARVSGETGLPLEIISGLDEARLAFLGASSELPADVADERLVVVDVGGRSTEFGFGRRNRLERSASLPVGVLGLTERHLGNDPATPADVTAAGAAAAAGLADLPDPGGPLFLVGIGATPATLGAVQLGGPLPDARTLHGHRLPRAEVARQVEFYRRLSLAERRQVPGLHPDRAAVILAGAVLLAAVMDRFACPVLRVSVHGLRQGLLRDRFERAPA